MILARTLMRRLRHVRHPVLVRLLTSLVLLCRVGATIRPGSAVEGKGTRVETRWYGDATCIPG
jgi:hypothetical protein